MKGGWVYIMANGAFGILYTGVTADIVRRVWEHKEGLIDGFTRRYGVTRLVYAEWHDDILRAIAREKAIKHWVRVWKLDLITRDNPNWDDLYQSFL